ncbi:hypothetical protein MMC20_006293 [Loxospora ochrophaea]|nr:hypothetical protein [Loxospora ochrophaea]
MAIGSSVVGATHLLKRYAASLTWHPLLSFSRNNILSLLSRIEVGMVRIVEHDGTVTACGSLESGGQTPTTELKVQADTFWEAMLAWAIVEENAERGVQGFAESYMLGEVTCSDLVAFFQIFILNRTQLFNATTLTSSLGTALTGLARSTNTLANSQLNASAHYDISNSMFAAFLSEDMTYSCPIWLPKSDPRWIEESLEDAQETKLQRFISLARIKPSDHVLEIGTGWGSFAIAAVRKTGCRITTLTLSREQKELAEKRIAAAGYMENIKVLLCDYRTLPVPQTGAFDKVISIEMLEAVGREYLKTYFECVDRLLKRDGGIAVFQCITIPETRYEAYSRGEDFIQKYIFPGGHLPTVSQLVENIVQGSSGTLIVDEILNIGGHYAKTLRVWRKKFDRNFENWIKPALLDAHSKMTDSDVDMFRRKWEYYFTYCEAGFNTKTLGDVILTVAREGAMEMLGGIPL